MHWEQEPGLLAPSLQAISSLACCMYRKKTSPKGKGRSSWNTTVCRESWGKCYPGRQAALRRANILSCSKMKHMDDWVPFPISFQLVGSLSLSVEDHLQDKKIQCKDRRYLIPHLLAELRFQLWLPPGKSISKCSRCGSRRHLQFQRADLCVSKTSVQSASSLEDGNFTSTQTVLPANGCNEVLRSTDDLNVVTLCVHKYVHIICIHIHE